MTPRTACLVLLLIAATAQCAWALEQAAASGTPVSNVSFSNRNLPDVLSAVAVQYKIVIGLSAGSMAPDPYATHINISVPNGTVRDVLDAVIRQVPEFSWTELADGAIHVSPRTAPLPLLEVILDNAAVKVTSRPGSTAGVSSSFLDQMTAFPEVHSWLARSGCRLNTLILIAGGTGRPDAPEPPTFQVTVQHATLLRLLNKIASQSRVYYWSAITDRRSQGPTDGCQINIQM